MVTDAAKKYHEYLVRQQKPVTEEQQLLQARSSRILQRRQRVGSYTEWLKRNLINSKHFILQLFERQFQGRRKNSKPLKIRKTGTPSEQLMPACAPHWATTTNLEDGPLSNFSSGSEELIYNPGASLVTPNTSSTVVTPRCSISSTPVAPSHSALSTLLAPSHRALSTSLAPSCSALSTPVATSRSTSSAVPNSDSDYTVDPNAMSYVESDSEFDSWIYRITGVQT